MFTSIQQHNCCQCRMTGILHFCSSLKWSWQLPAKTNEWVSEKVWRENLEADQQPIQIVKPMLSFRVYGCCENAKSLSVTLMASDNNKSIKSKLCDLFKNQGYQNSHFCKNYFLLWNFDDSTSGKIIWFAHFKNFH